MAENMGFLIAAPKEPPVLREVTDAKLLAAPNQAWHVNALLGDELVNEAIRAHNGVLTDAAIIDLFTQHTLPFFTDKSQHYLTMGTNELLENDFGPLISISSTKALEQFGLAKMEEANERGYACL